MGRFARERLILATAHRFAALFSGPKHCFRAAVGQGSPACSVRTERPFSGEHLLPLSDKSCACVLLHSGSKAVLECLDEVCSFNCIWIRVLMFALFQAATKALHTTASTCGTDSNLPLAFRSLLMRIDPVAHEAAVSCCGQFECPAQLQTADQHETGPSLHLGNYHVPAGDDCDL